MSDKLTEDDRRRIDTATVIRRLQSVKEHINIKIDEVILLLEKLYSEEKRL